MLKRDYFTLSVVGRVAIPGTAFNLRPRNLPDTTLIFIIPHYFDY